MAPPYFSPDTSISSHTLSAGSAPPPPMELQPASAISPTSLLANPLAFLQPTAQLNASFLAAAKRYLDPVAAGVSASQTQRQQDLRKKRKRRGDDDDDIRVLHLKKVHLEGFGVNQVFEQTRKIVEATAEEIELSLPETDGDGVVSVVSDENENEDIEEAEEYHSESSIGEEGVDWEYDGVDEDEDEDEQALDGKIDEDDDADMDDEANIFSDVELDDGPAETYEPDPNGLNDGFFSIDDFNKQTDFLEQQDQRGEVAASDDEEINWEADPVTDGPAKSKAKGGGAGDLSDDESDEGGPIFGNADLNAPEGDSGDEELGDGDLDGLDDGMNANNVMYTEFFAPPAQKAGKNKNSKKRGRPNPHNFPEKQPDQEEEVQENVEGTMARVHRDLFEDDDDVESEGDLSDVDPSDPKSRRSTHERRQAKLAEEIRKLEAANVAKREWQVSGEVRAADRPLNSLLEENLEFERAGKPVPLVTAETSEDIEALIKRRILAAEFDEVLRRRPDDLATGPRRGRFELEDTKSGKSLAEIYEEEHLRETDPNFIEAKDEKLKKEHDEISGLWKSVSAKLDSLSSSHFKPKPAAPNLEIRVDAPAIEMEDARPTAGGEVAGASMLAPQEVYKPGDEKNKAEIVTKSGMPFARDEMSREEKMSRRRRAKERAKKAGLNKPKLTDQTAEKKEKKRGEKKQLIGDLKKGGVQIIGRKGVLTDVEGKEVTDAVRKGAGSYKL